ncbi:MAG TPA: alkaline phosphatase family protein, partial [Thermoanaerobaculia bacterium]
MNLSRPTRRVVLIALVLGCGSVFAWHHVSAQQRRPRPVIVLGFDGADAALTERWMNEGKLPNLARLRAMGTYRPLTPTLPAQTPVSWSTFATGIDPGRTGIFDFLRRDPKTYLPVFAAFEEITEPVLFGARNAVILPLIALGVLFVLFLLILKIARRTWRTAAIASAVVAVIGAALVWIVVDRYVPEKRPGVINRREGIPMWDVVTDAGLKAKVVQVPVTFPATEMNGGHMLSGLGVPDMSGRIGKPFYFTSELDLKMSGSNEFSIEVVQLEDNRGVINTKIVGPPNRLFGDPPFIEQPMTITVAEDRSSLEIGLGAQRIPLKAGQWSDWVEFDFRFNPLVSVKGISRFHCIA